MTHWQTSRRNISFDRPLVMGILNVTPDSFSDGGEYLSADDALRRAEEMVAVDADEEIARVVPVIKVIAERFDVPISIDTSKAEVAREAVEAGAEIINDISGLRFDEAIASVAAETGTGLILMHSRGDFETMHSLPPVDDIIAEVTTDLRRAMSTAGQNGVSDEQIVLDVGIGFGKTQEQNLELLAKLDKLVTEFENYPMMIGTSRKSFLGKLLGGAEPSERLGGSLATALIAVRNGARILRVHDVRETVAACRVFAAAGSR
jgi:dihydropteroate synthase